jgi:hypothetical protein
MSIGGVRRAALRQSTLSKVAVHWVQVASDCTTV